jgi:4-alpha-glucanotransferase
MKKINFIFGVHNHQPVGNFGHVFEALYEKSYEPFIRVLHRHPKVKCTFHVTGPLLEWIEENKPEYFKILNEMVSRDQIEFFTGGMYEPILTILPDRDKIGQIRMLTDYLKKKFKVEAKGMWLAERVWEPHLTKALSDAGVEYVVIDDAHLKAAGLNEEQTFGYYVMEEQGTTAAVFPISEKMRYLVPFQAVEETIQYLRSVATEEDDRCVVLMDDGEKFGGWPDTYKWVYEEGWLEKFFSALEQNAEWLNATTFAEYKKRHSSRGIINLPTGSYTEMGEWSLPTDAASEYDSVRHEVRDRGEMPRFEKYLKGGFWRNFFTKYSESNHLHKKLLWVSQKVEDARLKIAKKGTAKQKTVLEEATRALYRGECNCPYWHGVFGGLYLNHLRFAMYRQFIEAEKLADSLLSQPSNGFKVAQTDFNKDGLEEIVVESKGYHAIFAPAKGGSLIEIDYLKSPINLLDTLTRRKEAYHEKLRALQTNGNAGGSVSSIHDMVRVKEPGLENKLFYDPENRASLVERILPMGTKVENLMSAQYQELGDFHQAVFVSKVEEPKGKGKPVQIMLSHQGVIKGLPVELTKKVILGAGDFDLKTMYRLKNFGSKELEFLLMTEWNLTLLAGDAPDRNYFVKGRDLSSPRLNSVGMEENVTEFGMRDGWLKLEINFQCEKPGHFWRYPVETISQSEGGFEKVYQGSCLLLGWMVTLPPQGTFETPVTVRLKEIKGF